MTSRSIRRSIRFAPTLAELPPRITPGDLMGISTGSSGYLDLGYLAGGGQGFSAGDTTIKVFDGSGSLRMTCPSFCC